MQRGARGSAGRTSWTAKPELEDYVSVYVLALTFLGQIRQARVLPETARSILVLAGYSYGSMITSHLPAPTDVLAISRGQTKNLDALTEIRRTTDRLAKYFVKSMPEEQHSGTYASIHQEASGTAESSPHRHNVPNSTNLPIEDTTVEIPLDANTSLHLVDTAYLLISPILGVSASLARAFQPLGSAEGPTRSSELDKPRSNLTTHPSCAVFGDADTFTGKQKLRKWAQNLKDVDGSRFASFEVTAVGHFWSEEGADVKLKGCISSWLREIRTAK